MYTVIKNKGKMTEAYQLGSDHEMIKKLEAEGKICSLGDGRYEVYSQEIVAGVRGELAYDGDWIKVDGKGYPYPNTKEYFESNHKKVQGDTFEQLPKPLLAWDAHLQMCPEVLFLTEKKGLMIDVDSREKRYSAELWGTYEVAADDALIVFYSISYGKDGNVVECDWNFVSRDEFDRTYSVIE